MLRVVYEKNEILGLTKDDIDFEKRIMVPFGHSGVTKSSYVSFYNSETEQVLNKIELEEQRLFNVSDRQFKKIWKNAKKRSDAGKKRKLNYRK